MSRIIYTLGLPGSGKTTWAKETQKQNPVMVLVNKDDLREMLHQGVHSKGREALVLQIRDFIIEKCLELGNPVIVHDTNLDPKHKKRFEEIASDPKWKGKCEMECKDFTDVPLQVCIERDMNRGEKRVGASVIKDMYKRYLQPEIRRPQHNIELPNAIICDLDGTLCLFGNKNPYDRDFENDEVDPIIRYILNKFNQEYCEIIFVSGRSSKFRRQTISFLRKNVELFTSIKYDLLFMRPEGDGRKDVEIKKEIYEKYIKDKYNVLFVLDDRNQVVEFWRSQGLTCLQVADGDF